MPGIAPPQCRAFCIHPALCPSPSHTTPLRPRLRPLSLGSCLYPPLAPLSRPRTPLQGVLAAAPIAQLGKPRGCKTGIKLEHIFPVMNYQGVAEKVHTIGNRVYIFTGFLAGYILPRQRDCYLLRQGRWRCMGQGGRG